RTVDLIDCELVPDIRKYRVVPPVLIARFEALKPVKVFDLFDPRSGFDQDKRQNELFAYEARVIELSGVLTVPREESQLSMRVDEADCHFDRQYASALKSMRDGWPIRVRGKVATTKEARPQLIGCGLRYRD